LSRSLAGDRCAPINAADSETARVRALDFLADGRGARFRAEKAAKCSKN